MHKLLAFIRIFFYNTVVMKIGIFYNAEQVPSAVPLSYLKLMPNEEVRIFSSEEEIGDVDRLLVLGGDGTVLRAARRAAELSIPLFAVNYGTIGFLTEFEKDEQEEAVALLLSKDCSVIRRQMLEVRHNDSRFICLNECSLLRAVSPEEENKVAKIFVEIDGEEAGEVIADGLIVATPTGSTAYSLSAGGSIMMPDCETFMLTPVCAFSMKSRPIVYPSRSELIFRIPKGHELLLYGDGKFLKEVRSTDEIGVRKASRSAAFLTRDGRSYFRRITEKIN